MIYKDEQEWQRNRMIEFRIAQSAYVGGGMAKAQPLYKVKKPSDLYPIGDEIIDNKPLEGKEGADFIKNMFPKNE